jgi:hypothetical protein
VKTVKDSSSKMAARRQWQAAIRPLVPSSSHSSPSPKKSQDSHSTASYAIPSARRSLKKHFVLQPDTPPRPLSAPSRASGRLEQDDWVRPATQEGRQTAQRLRNTTTRIKSLEQPRVAGPDQGNLRNTYSALFGSKPAFDIYCFLLKLRD